MTHTPGPWIVNIDRDYAPEGEIGELVTVDVIKAEVMPLGYPVIANLDSSPFDDDEIIANAYLIAATPQLLEALKMVEWVHGTQTTYCPWCYGQWTEHKPDCPRQLAIAAAEREEE